MYQLCINVLVLFNQLYQSIQSSLRSGQGHSGDVVAAACFQLADGAWRVVSGSSDETLRVWDPVAGGEALVDTVCMRRAASTRLTSLFAFIVLMMPLVPLPLPTS